MPASNSNPPPDDGDAPARPLRLFEAYGLELEYMLVDGESLDIAPAADQLLEAAAGELTDEFFNGEIAWNNELALHVIEFKCNGPRPSLAGLGAAFAANVKLANDKLGREGLRLMPTAMHPWMDPNDVELWPHGTRVIYDTFDRIFSCKGHGWANLQSQQINLPFAGDEEFAQLHAAIRFLLPILPGLAASSPVVDGERNGILDNRLVVYRSNCARIPSITGDVVPEPVGSIGEYHERVLEPIYRDLAPHYPDGVLRNEWVNARGAIARFDRMAIEIRVLDVQETPVVDVAYAALIVEILKLLAAEQWLDRDGMNSWRTAELGKLFTLASRQGEGAGIGDKRFLAAFGLRSSGVELKGLWEHLIETVSARGSLDAQTGRLLEHYLRHGTLATRIGSSLGLLPTRAKLARVYEELCEALADSRPFTPPAPRREPLT
ncbi:MAG TPA: glutamate-cysteine ligase family protein [Gammaproteobacteria bacterium]|nr:glutamate-cysteine ligase family protein [Gammaproteobacteria bacterium]